MHSSSTLHPKKPILFKISLGASGKKNSPFSHSSHLPVNLTPIWKAVEESQSWSEKWEINQTSPRGHFLFCGPMISLRTCVINISTISNKTQPGVSDPKHLTGEVTGGIVALLSQFGSNLVKLRFGGILKSHARGQSMCQDKNHQAEIRYTPRHLGKLAKSHLLFWEIKLKELSVTTY